MTKLRHSFRRTSKWSLGVAVLLAVGSSVGQASATPPAADPEAVVAQELVVTAKVRGPAWWRVSNGASTVYILGGVGILPKGLKWDTSTAKRHLQGANQYISGPRVTAGIGDVFTLISLRKHFRSKGPMENGLSPDLKQRYLAVKPTLNPDPKAYSNWTPLAAGLLMIGDFRKKARLDNLEPDGTVSRLAREQGVKIVPAGSYKAVPFLRAAESGLATSGPTCLADALDEIEAGPGRLKIAADGWSRGNIADALSAQRGYEKCLNSFPDGADLAAKVMTDTTAAIDQALTKPGHSVALVNLRTLLAQGGVLQRLKAKGYSVVTPDQ